MGSRRGIPDATVARLPIYHRVLTAFQQEGVKTVSSEELATESGVNSAKLRKDLSYLGSYGTRGVGYDVEFLVYQIARELGLTQDWSVVIVGIGNLGRALANYGGFASRGFQVVGLVDSDDETVGQQVGPVLIDLGVDQATATAALGSQAVAGRVRHLDDLENLVETSRPSIAVIATPAAAAQDVCDRLVAAGLTSILNFAPVVLAVPEGVEVRKVDLATELQILAFHEQRRIREAESKLAQSELAQSELAESTARTELVEAGPTDLIGPLEVVAVNEPESTSFVTVEESTGLIPAGGKL